MSHRIQIIVPDHVYQSLTATAAAHQSRPSTIAAAIVTAATDIAPQPFTGKRPDTRDVDDRDAFVNERLAAESSTGARGGTSPSSGDGSQPALERATWLEQHHDPEWRRTMWLAVKRLMASYPVLHDIVSYEWTTDRLTRDGVLALTVWRQQIDEHAGNDPRLELQWITALRDYAAYHETHRRQLTHPIDAHQRPDGW
ncbi:hypothetical protein DSM112329_00470 [Paraconexibacter sp. AEG42_29]|uniref:Uncharacterized protein n=1 Tax=Paraconexibacter sp. AEG42_29 TaxID=2997339 RepID=A0AAU7AQ75_9ACTN